MFWELVGIALILTVILIILYYVSKREPLEILKKSNGTFDQPAAEALDALANPQTADEAALRANIIRYNLMEDRIGEDMNVGAAAMGAAATDVNAGANLVPLRTVLGGYVTALAMAVNEPAFTFFQDVATLHDRLNTHQFGGFNLLNEGLNEDIVEEFADDDFTLYQIDLFNALFANAAPTIVHNNVKKRVANASKAPDRATAVANALHTEYRDDRQNVHDSKVNAELNSTLNKIAGDVKNVDAELTELRAYISAYPTLDKRADAMRVYDIMRLGSPISTYNSTESFILAAVWCRSKHPSNSGSKQLMQEALVNALADGIENGLPVCINGRCARVLNSMVLLDFDESVGSAMTFDAYKNQIYSECKDLFDMNLQRADISTDPEMRTLAASYKDPSIEVSEKAEETFKGWVKEDIDELLMGYKDKLNAREIEQLRTECYAYALI